ncbi:pre-mRNA-splicing factor 38B [Ophiocordyceps camponoti-floridani]|uniref:Pre-mRNA-splicing factor 38B n=1 Tax=Ophiocordyceps camponoti-floridani TaxID=2030778 RepID=A0A8H4Q867_9HYPO|nr:pre-mRNA-splicing factor 38B [Ophiocordyceps camponoti-floridani]
MPRPNTRFLRHIIKSTDSHNKALLAKEAAESKARLEDLDRSQEATRLRRNPNAREIRSRQMGDIRAILGAQKRTGHVSKNGHDSRASRLRYGDHGRSAKSGARESRHDRHVRHRHGRSDRHEPEGRGGILAREDRRPSASADEKEGDDHQRRRERSRLTSPKQKRRSRSPDTGRTTMQGQQGSSNPHPSPEGTGSANGDDSDPLDDFMGPAPPANFRGRGTMGGAASLDRRFSESYDPKTDVDMGDGDTDDWDDAAERFRDRQKLKLSQAQRMKAAGFTDEQLGRMQGEPEREVVWSKAGEQRAWDQGKDVDVDVDVDVEMDHAPGLFSEDE